MDIDNVIREVIPTYQGVYVREGVPQNIVHDFGVSLAWTLSSSRARRYNRIIVAGNDDTVKKVAHGKVPPSGERGLFFKADMPAYVVLVFDKSKWAGYPNSEPPLSCEKLRFYNTYPIQEKNGQSFTSINSDVEYFDNSLTRIVIFKNVIPVEYLLQATERWATYQIRKHHSTKLMIDQGQILIDTKGWPYKSFWSLRRKVVFFTNANSLDRFDNYRIPHHTITFHELPYGYI